MTQPRTSRVNFRKNRHAKRRRTDVTRDLADDEADDRLVRSERISGKGELTRKRTVKLADDLPAASVPDAAACWRGQVLHAHGLESFVRDAQGTLERCTIRQVLRDLATDQRHPVLAGDWVRVLGRGEEATIQSIEPRRTALSRASRGRRHTLVANVDQVLIVGSAAEPDLKPGLIDRLIVAAEAAGIRPVICLNKADLVDPASLIPLAGVYARMGYTTVLCSTRTGLGMQRLRAELPGRVTAVIGQSGVGKSSLLNGLEPALALPVGDVSRDND
jgi:ribosome biogenesis GTPase